MIWRKNPWFVSLKPLHFDRTGQFSRTDNFYLFSSIPYSHVPGFLSTEDKLFHMQTTDRVWLDLVPRQILCMNILPVCGLGAQRLDPYRAKRLLEVVFILKQMWKVFKSPNFDLGKSVLALGFSKWAHLIKVLENFPRISLPWWPHFRYKNTWIHFSSLRYLYNLHLFWSSEYKLWHFVFLKRPFSPSDLK